MNSSQHEDDGLTEIKPKRGFFDAASKIYEELALKLDGDVGPPLKFKKGTLLDEASLDEGIAREKLARYIDKNDPFAPATTYDWALYPIDDTLKDCVESKLKDGSKVEELVKEFPQFKKEVDVLLFIAKVKCNVYLNSFHQKLYNQDLITEKLGPFAKIPTFDKLRNGLPKTWKAMDEAITANNN